MARIGRPLAAKRSRAGRRPYRVSDSDIDAIQGRFPDAIGLNGSTNGVSDQTYKELFARQGKSLYRRLTKAMRLL